MEVANPMPCLTIQSLSYLFISYTLNTSHNLYTLRKVLALDINEYGQAVLWPSTFRLSYLDIYAY